MAAALMAAAEATTERMIFLICILKVCLCREEMKMRMEMYVNDE